jgi:uncharacterized protein
MEFDWDQGNWPKCGDHGLTQADIEFALESDPLVLPDPFPDEQRHRAIGQIDDGRFVFIVFTMRDGKVRPISARPLHAKELKRYV